MTWRKQTIGDLVALQRGHDLTEPDRQPGSVPVIGSAGQNGSHNVVRAKGPGVAIGRSGGSIGKVTFVNEDYWPHNTCIYVTDFRGNDPRFVAYLLSTIDLAQLNSGAAQPSLNRNFVYGVRVAYPDPPEQSRIADILSAYDDLIENNRRRMALLEESARQLYQEWFVRLRFPGHEHTRIVDGVPEGWEPVPLGYFVDNDSIELQTGPFGTQLKASDYAESGTPVINVRNIGYGDLRADKLELVPEVVVNRLGMHILKSGDIVFGRKGAVDRHVLISAAQAGWMQGSDCIRLRTQSEAVCPIFLSFAFREESYKQWMLTQCSNKVTMASLNQEVIARIPLLVPDRPLVREFHEFTSSILKQIGTLSRQSQRAAEARDLLLPRMMSGEIVV